MTTVKRRWARMGNRIGVSMYRKLDGRMAGGRGKVRVLMITTPGRRSGIPRSTCVSYLETAPGLVVWGTGSGAPHDPDWFENLRAAQVATVQVRDRSFPVHPRELVGDERDAMWRDVILAAAPQVDKYAKRAGRVIPVALLEPETTP